MKNQPPLFIVDGPDACGKTTYSKKLALTLGGIYWHITSSPLLAPAQIDYQTNALHNASHSIQSGVSVVFDRFWPSEAVYAPIFRPDAPKSYEALEQKLNESGLHPIYIFCMDGHGAGEAERRHATHQDPDHPYSSSDYLQIYHGYYFLYTRLAQTATVYRKNFGELPRLISKPASPLSDPVLAAVNQSSVFI